MDRHLATLTRLISHRPFTDECVSAASVGTRSGGGPRAGPSETVAPVPVRRSTCFATEKRSCSGSKTPAVSLKDVAT